MKLRLLFLYVLIFPLVSNLLFAQIEFDKTNHNYGDMIANTPRFIDIQLTNKSDKKVFVLSIRKPKEVVYITNKQTLEPDSSIFIRLQVNPKKRGKFSYSIDVFTSDQNEPTVIRLEGNVKELEENAIAAMQTCPDFSSRPAVSATDFKLTVVTLDEETKKELSKSTVSLIQNGIEIGNWKTNSAGKIIQRVPLGYTYFYATHEGYFSTEMGTYINFQRNYVTLELKRDTTKIEVIPIPIQTDSIVEGIPVSEKDTVVATLQEILAETTPEPTLETVSVEFKKLPLENFESQYFKPVNVVFVLDISSSMLAGDKLELMKYSLYQLNNYLRPQDKIGIVTYSNKAKVLVPPTAGNEKKTIQSAVEKLKPYGGTAGGDGIKMGFEQALTGYIENGANLVIVITDGAFNKNSDDYLKYLEQHKDKGIQLSVVGIKNTLKDEERMKEAAKNGNGRYVPINKLIDAQYNLVQEIRISSFRI